MNKTYCLNHWVLTLIIAPFFLPLLDFFSGSTQGIVIGLRDTYAVMLVMSAICSVPTLGAYYFIFKALDKSQVKPVVAKFILISFTIAGLTVTLLLIGGSASKEVILAYSLASVATGFLLRIKLKTKQSINPAAPE
jgi:hypothetical protein